MKTDKDGRVPPGHPKLVVRAGPLEKTLFKFLREPSEIGGGAGPSTRIYWEYGVSGSKDGMNGRIGGEEARDPRQGKRGRSMR